MYNPQELLDQIEYENSCLSNIEVQHKQEIILAENIKKGKVNVDLETSTKITAQDSMDAWKAERNKFQLAPRTTDADKTNDVTSLHRKLEHTLVLLTEQQLGDKKYFLLPQGKLKDGETLRQTAERVLTATCGQSFNAQFWGNAPCAIYKYKYPKNAKDADAVGAKIFFFRAVYKGGNVDKKFGKFEWLDKSGVLKKLEDKQRYVRSVKPLLLWRINHDTSFEI